MILSDPALTALLAKQDVAAFEQVFKQHYKDLHAYAITMLKDHDVAEEMVQQVFFKLWDRSGKLSITGPVRAYLYRAVHNECLNHIKHLKVREVHQMHVVHRMKTDHESLHDRLPEQELAGRIREALNELPEQCRTIFQMSRFEHLKYQEIAERLELSVKTVENQMGKALRIMRRKLAEFLMLGLIILLNL